MIATASCLESSFAHLCPYDDYSSSLEDREDHFSLSGCKISSCDAYLMLGPIADDVLEM